MYQNLEVDMWISSYHVETVSGYGSAARCANQSHYGAQQIVNIIITLGWCKCRGLSGRQWLDTGTRAAVTLITATTASSRSHRNLSDCRPRTMRHTWSHCSLQKHGG